MLLISNEHRERENTRDVRDPPAIFHAFFAIRELHCSFSTLCYLLPFCFLLPLVSQRKKDVSHLKSEKIRSASIAEEFSIAEVESAGSARNYVQSVHLGRNCSRNIIRELFISRIKTPSFGSLSLSLSLNRHKAKSFDTRHKEFLHTCLNADLHVDSPANPEEQFPPHFLY